MGKASTAAKFQKPTFALENGCNGGRTVLLSAGVVLMGGGLPLIVGGHGVGSVGVSGLTP